MALKLPDSAVPMGDFPVAKAVDIDFDDGENLQDKFDNGELGGGGGSPEKQIKDWVSGETYEIGDYVYYDGKLYRCLATNNDVDFDEIIWERLTYDIDELSKEDVEGLLGLTKEEIEAMTDLILDTEVRIDKTYSSSKIYSAIQQCLEDSKTYTLKEINKLSGASYKVVASTSEMTSESIIYLLPNATNYDMYIVEEDGTVTKIGDTTINLDNYYTKTEITDNYYDKATCDGKYALITTVDNHINDTGLHITTDERTKWNNTVDMIKVNGDVLDYIKNNPKKNLTIYWRTTDINTPYTAGFTQSGGGTLISNVFDEKWGSVIGTCGGDFLCINRLIGGVWKGWEKLCTTKVADTSGVATITNGASGTVRYKVINGTCYVSVLELANGLTGGGVCEVTGLPKTSIYTCTSLTVGGAIVGELWAKENSTTFQCNKTGAGGGYISFSYPVAE